MEARAPNQSILVTTVADAGPGSLREAIDAANRQPGMTTIRFDSDNGTFGEPQVIKLEDALPVIEGGLVLDGYIPDRLWKASGVTLSGGDRHRVLEVAPDAQVELLNLTIANGAARRGAGILNHGDLQVSGVTFEQNQARQAGGALYHAEGSLDLVNSTLSGNSARRQGGGVASHAPARLVNVTLSDNGAGEGGSLYSTADLHLANSILANSPQGLDCVATGPFGPDSGHNLIETHDGCGEPILQDDPILLDLGYYNGPARTRPINGNSPAVNMGRNAWSVDRDGQPFRWDQRGNGDPRFVSGYTDLGAFELQAFPDLVVDTAEDTGLRGCMPSGLRDCPLRAAIELAVALGRGDVIRFDARVFTLPAMLQVDLSHLEIATPVSIDASGVPPVAIRLKGTDPGQFDLVNAILAAD